MARNGSGTYSLPAGNPVTSGTAISSSTHNSTMSDMATALTQSIASDGQTTPTANLPMGTFRHTNVGDASVRTDYAAAGQVQDGSFTWAGTAGGTANAITLTLSPSITAYAAGQSFTYKSGASANTGAMTVAVSGLTTKAIQKNGAALASGDHPAGRWFRITYDGTAFQLEQLSPTSAEVTASLALKANLASPTFTGTVTIPGATVNGNLIMSGAIRYARTSVAAHATNANIWAANFIDLTGSAITITGFAAAPQAGCESVVYCNAAHTITNSANLIIEGISQTIQAGDWLRVRALSTTIHQAEVVRIQPFATGPEAIAGTNATKIITASSLAYGQTLGVTGRTWTPGGKLEQWGRQAVDADLASAGLVVTITFPVAFPNVAYRCAAQVYSSDASANRNMYCVRTELTTTYAKFLVIETVAAAQANWGLDWEAIGS